MTSLSYLMAFHKSPMRWMRPTQLSIVIGGVALMAALACGLSMMRFSREVEAAQSMLAEARDLDASLSNAALFTVRYGLSDGSNDDDRRFAEQSWSDAERLRASMSVDAPEDVHRAHLMQQLDQKMASNRLGMDQIWAMLDRGDAASAREITLNAVSQKQRADEGNILNAIEALAQDDIRAGQQAEREWLVDLLGLFALALAVAVRASWVIMKQARSSAYESHAYQMSLRKLALSDPLTHLGNRRLLEERFERAQRAADRSGEPLLIAVIDLNRFKEINDRFGHDAGDHVLVEVAQRLRRGCGEFDTVTRSGGDEFIVVFQGRQGTPEPQLAQSLATVLNQPTVFHNHSIDISASVGLAAYPRDGRTLLRLTQCADRRMYHDKVASSDRRSRPNTTLFTPSER